MILAEDWKSMAVAGLVGLGSLAGANSTEAKPEPDIRITKTSEEDQHKDYAINILARTIWAEGRGEKDLDNALRAIATSIYNRVQAKSNKIGNDPLAYVKIVLTPYQYSAWNGWTIKNPTKYPEEKERSGRAWNLSKQIATEMINGKFSPIKEVKNSTHYFAGKRLKDIPSWARDKEMIKIGNHSFVNEPMRFPSPKLGAK